MTDDTIRDLLVEIRTRLDVALVQLADHETRVRGIELRPGSPAVAAQVADQEARIRSLERARWLAVGMAAAAGGLAGRLAGII